MSNPASSVPQTRTGTSKNKPNVNPTSTGRTVYQYAIIAFLAANYLLHSHPRHIRHRETQKKASKSAPDAGHFSNPFYEDLPRPPSPPLPSPGHERDTRNHEKLVGPYGRAENLHNRYPRSIYRENPHYRARSGLHKAVSRELSPSGAQRSEAWTCIRSVPPSTLVPNNHIITITDTFSQTRALGSSANLPIYV
jgi:hypothetical protein